MGEATSSFISSRRVGASRISCRPSHSADVFLLFTFAWPQPYCRYLGFHHVGASQQLIRAYSERHQCGVLPRRLEQFEFRSRSGVVSDWRRCRKTLEHTPPSGTLLRQPTAARPRYFDHAAEQCSGPFGASGRRSLWNAIHQGRVGRARSSREALKGIRLQHRGLPELFPKYLH